MKGQSVFVGRHIINGEIICNYDGELCPYHVFHKRHEKYNVSSEGSYILEFKFQEKHWAIDATKEDDTFGRLINQSKHVKNVKPVVSQNKGKHFVYFIAVTDILKDKEILYNYCDNSTTGKVNFPWLRK